jgi:hypothetical protein
MNLVEQSTEHSTPIYRRELPGGGYVLIQVDDGQAESAPVRTRVWVERRGASERRTSHSPIIIAEVDGDEHSPAFANLYRIASDNAAIARALMRVEGRAD